jgi:hypothetical protein
MYLSTFVFFDRNVYEQDIFDPHSFVPFGKNRVIVRRFARDIFKHKVTAGKITPMTVIISFKSYKRAYVILHRKRLKMDLMAAC